MYAFFFDQLTETPDVPSGYTFQKIAKKEDTPKDWTFVETQQALDAMIANAESVINISIDPSYKPDPIPTPKPPTPKPRQRVLSWPPSALPLTWRVNWANAEPLLNSGLSRSEMLGAMRANYDKFTDAPGALAFEEINSGTPTLEISFQKVDGPSGTLAFVYQPASGFNMGACGAQCGDYYFDNEETYSITDFQNIHSHETGHAVGAEHFESGIMKATYNFGSPLFTEIDPLLQQHILSGYPVSFA